MAQTRTRTGNLTVQELASVVSVISTRSSSRSRTCRVGSLRSGASARLFLEELAEPQPSAATTCWLSTSRTTLHRQLCHLVAGARLRRHGDTARP